MMPLRAGQLVEYPEGKSGRMVRAIYTHTSQVGHGFVAAWVKPLGSDKEKAVAVKKVRPVIQPVQSLLFPDPVPDPSLEQEPAREQQNRPPETGEHRAAPAAPVNEQEPAPPGFRWNFWGELVSTDTSEGDAQVERDWFSGEDDPVLPSEMPDAEEVLEKLLEKYK